MIRMRRLLPAAFAVIALTAAGCSEQGESVTPAESEPASSGTLAGCATAPAAEGTEPQWTFDGAAGSVRVAAATDEYGPLIEVTTPFTVDETVVETLVEGDGAVIAEDANVTVCYEGVSGRTGEVFDSSYERGVPQPFNLTGVVDGFQIAIAGQKVGSSVAVAMTPEDGYGDTPQPGSPIEPGETLVFEIQILEAS